MTKEAEAARLALEHCGVVRASTSHPGYHALWLGNRARMTMVAGREGIADYRLLP